MDYRSIGVSNKLNIDDKPQCNDDFVSIGLGFIKNINIKVAVFIFLFGLFIFSDVFIESVLNKFNNASRGMESTTKGTVIQLLFLTLFYIITDMLVKFNIL